MIVSKPANSKIVDKRASKLKKGVVSMSSNKTAPAKNGKKPSKLAAVKKLLFGESKTGSSKASSSKATGVKAALGKNVGKTVEKSAKKKESPKAVTKKAGASVQTSAKGKAPSKAPAKAAAASKVSNTKASANTSKSASAKGAQKNGSGTASTKSATPTQKDMAVSASTVKSTASKISPALLAKSGGKKSRASSSRVIEGENCREVACEGLSTTGGYCRMHYIKNWKKIKRKEVILREKKLNQYIEELVAKYPDKYIEAIRQDLANDKDFAKVIYDLDLDESVDDFDGDADNADSIIDSLKRDFDDDSDAF